MCELLLDIYAICTSLILLTPTEALFDAIIFSTDQGLVIYDTVMKIRRHRSCDKFLFNVGDITSIYRVTVKIVIYF